MYVGLVEAADFKAATPGNSLCKYADDTYIVIPDSNSHSRIYELEHIEAWVKHNNLTLNRAKTREIIVQDKRSRRVASNSSSPSSSRHNPKYRAQNSKSYCNQCYSQWLSILKKW